MEHKIFSIYDQKADAYLPPFTLPQRAMAERTFFDCVTSKDHAFCAHPGDYTLCELGEFSDKTAKITPYEVPKTLGTGIEFVKPVTHEGNSDGTTLSNDAPILTGAISRNP